MFGEALGLIETIGLAAAVTAADAAVKSANVMLIGYELTRGGGMVTVKITGDVGAVQAAVAAAAESACRVSNIWATHIIPRPHHETKVLISTPETVGLSLSAEQNAPAALQQEAEVGPLAVNEANDAATEALKDDKEADEQQVSAGGMEKDVEMKPERDASSCGGKDEHEICNFCGDPECPRKKGEPKTLCIHYKKKIKED